jgi:hypothetical protein
VIKNAARQKAITEGAAPAIAAHARGRRSRETSSKIAAQLPPPDVGDPGDEGMPLSQRESEPPAQGQGLGLLRATTCTPSTTLNTSPNSFEVLDALVIHFGGTRPRRERGGSYSFWALTHEPAPPLGCVVDCSKLA